MGPLGRPRLHFREVDSTNARAAALAREGAVHGTLVTASAQSAGRGRQGRVWSAPPGSSLLMSLVLRSPGRMLPLAAALAVADVVQSAAGGPDVTIKWPNDVWLDGRKVAGILVEGRPQEGWAVLGVGVNVAVSLSDLPGELRDTAATLGLASAHVELLLASLLRALGERLIEEEAVVLEAFRSRDALLGRSISWASGSGVAAGVDSDGCLLVDGDDGKRHTLGSGEVHLRVSPL